MHNYLGLDIGTTNIKGLCLNAEGEIVEVLSKKTPYKNRNSVSFFDLKRIEDITDEMIKHFSSTLGIKGIAFSSVGESVVPVNGNDALYDPILWSDTITEDIWKQHQGTVLEKAPYSVTGLKNDKFYSIYKILWMLEHINTCRDAEIWLPLNSYLSYRLTGKAVVDFSQGCRTSMINIHKRTWNTNLLNTFDLIPEKGMPNLQYTGTYAGDYKDGIRVFTGGHDHITGLFGITLLSGKDELYYDSMGTAGVIAMLRTEKKGEMHLDAPFSKDGYIGVGFKKKEYYTLKTIHNYGRVLGWLFKTVYDKDVSYYKEINPQIDLYNLSSTFMAVENNPLSPEWLYGMEITGNFYEKDRSDLIANGYLYLSYMSRQILRQTSEAFRYTKRVPYIAGGGITKNKLFMTIKATMLGKEVWILPTTEITALGTALAAAYGDNQKELIKGCGEKMQFKRVIPGVDIKKPVKDKKQMMDYYFKHLEVR